MSLPHAYSNKTDSIPQYFDALLQIQPPDVFDAPFLARLNFKNFIDRSFIAILEELKFITSDGKPTPRYLDFLDPRKSKKIITEGINTAYSAIIHADINPHTMEFDDIFNDLRKLYAGSKSDMQVAGIARTFIALSDYAASSQLEPAATEIPAAQRTDTTPPGPATVAGKAAEPANPATQTARPVADARGDTTPAETATPEQAADAADAAAADAGKAGDAAEAAAPATSEEMPLAAAAGDEADNTPEAPAGRATDAGDTPEILPGTSPGPEEIQIDSLRYRVNIVLPETRDPAVYDAIFTSLKKNLLTTHRENRDTSYA